MISQIICRTDNINLIFFHFIFGESLLHAPAYEVSAVLRNPIEYFYKR